jgi:hypothetical protein
MGLPGDIQVSRFVTPLPLLLLLMGTAAAGENVRQLFDGKDLEGWQQVGPGSFVVEHGLLKSTGGMGLLWYTREQLANATIRVVFKLNSKESDSGVFIRIPAPPSDPWMAINQGYEIEIGEWPNEYGRSGVVYSFSRAMAHPLKAAGQWNTMDIAIDGPHTVVHLNGVKVTDYMEGQAVPQRAAAGFRLHWPAE